MPNIRHALTIDTPAAKIYAAITQPDRLAAWWMPEVTGDPSIGGVLDFSNPEAGHRHRMRIVKLSENRRTEWECLSGDPESEWVGTRVTFDLDARGESTLVRFAHDDWQAETAHMAECNHNWGRLLRRLKQQCEAM